MIVPILSIIVATRNRSFYCLKLINEVLNLPDEDFELIIQDNSDDPILLDYVTNFIDDSRLKYQYTKPPFSSIDNFNAAFEMACGEYVCLIGDDDGINPVIIEVARKMRFHKIESLASERLPEYYWPESTDRYLSGNLSLPEFSDTVVSYNPLKRVGALLHSGIVNYIPFNLPRVYHGIVKRDLMETIKEVTGVYFNGLSPDIYSSISLSFFVRKHTLVDFPLTIAGTCKESTSAASVNKLHNGKLEDAPHFRNRSGYIWERKVPKYYSVQTIWAETAIKALREIGQEQLTSQFNVELLVAQSYLRNFKIREIIKNEIKLYCCENNESYYLFSFRVSVLIFMIMSKYLIMKTIRLLFQKSAKLTCYDKVDDIGAAMKILTSDMKEKKYSINFHIIASDEDHY